MEMPHPTSCPLAYMEFTCSPGGQFLCKLTAFSQQALCFPHHRSLLSLPIGLSIRVGYLTPQDQPPMDKELGLVSKYPSFPVTHCVHSTCSSLGPSGTEPHFSQLKQCHSLTLRCFSPFPVSLSSLTSASWNCFPN